MDCNVNKLLLIAAPIAIYFGLQDKDVVHMHASDVHPNCSVVMFTTDWCPVCTTARSYFDNKDYDYCEFDVEKDELAEQYYRELDTQGVPTILIGNRMSVGFNPAKIDELMANFDQAL